MPDNHSQACFAKPIVEAEITNNRYGVVPLFIRSDAGRRMGTGHVMRCIALGQAWQDAGGKVVFITCCDNVALLRRLRDENFTVIELSNPAEFIPRLISDLRPFDFAKASSDKPTFVPSPQQPTTHQLSTGPGWLVLDGYHFDLDCQRTVRKTGFKLLLIDDYNHLPEYECDILLNQNINASELDYCINSGAKLLLGTRYALLRREFRTLPALSRVEKRKSRRKFPDIGKNILVTLGGADPDNVTLKVIKAIQQIDLPNLHTKIIVGPANPHIESLRQAVASSTINCELINSVRDMTDLMIWADLAVSAGGSTCWELCALGVPFLTLVLAENQRGIAEGLAASNGSENFGWARFVAAEEVASILDRLLSNKQRRRKMASICRSLVDGFGVGHVCRTIKEAAM